jgi:hypothetical protein
MFSLVSAHSNQMLTSRYAQFVALGLKDPIPKCECSIMLCMCVAKPRQRRGCLLQKKTEDRAGDVYACKLGSGYHSTCRVRDATIQPRTSFCPHTISLQPQRPGAPRRESPRIMNLVRLVNAALGANLGSPIREFQRPNGSDARLIATPGLKDQ